MLSLGAGGSAFKLWRRRLGGSEDVKELIRLARSVRPLTDIGQLVMQDEDPECGADTGVLRNQSQIARDFERFCRVAVLPYWEGISRRLSADRTARGQIMLSHGIGRMLATVHPAVHWKPPLLEVPGRGHDVGSATTLVLAPSVFLAGRPPILTGLGAESGQLILSYPVPIDPKWANSLWQASEGVGGALSALMGRTRAAVLLALTRSGSTTEISERAGVSSATVSQHTSVLRTAGLITTVRTANSVQHALTPLGDALIHERLVGQEPDDQHLSLLLLADRVG